MVFSFLWVVLKFQECSLNATYEGIKKARQDAGSSVLVETGHNMTAVIRTVRVSVYTYICMYFELNAGRGVHTVQTKTQTWRRQ